MLRTIDLSRIGAAFRALAALSHAIYGVVGNCSKVLGRFNVLFCALAYQQLMAQAFCKDVKTPSRLFRSFERAINGRG